MQSKLSLKDIALIVYLGMSGRTHPRLSLASAEQILSRQLVTAFCTTGVALASSTLILGVFIITLYNRVDPMVLGWWSAGVVLSLVALAAVMTGYAADQSEDASHSRFWARALEQASIFRALVWAIGVILFYPDAKPRREGHSGTKLRRDHVRRRLRAERGAIDRHRLHRDPGRRVDHRSGQ